MMVRFRTGPRPHRAFCFHKTSVVLIKRACIRSFRVHLLTARQSLDFSFISHSENFKSRD